jgi:hypothetical protein
MLGTDFNYKIAPLPKRLMALAGITEMGKDLLCSLSAKVSLSSVLIAMNSWQEHLDRAD